MVVLVRGRAVRGDDGKLRVTVSVLGLTVVRAQLERPGVSLAPAVRPGRLTIVRLSLLLATNS